MSALGLSEPVVLWSSTSFPLRPRTRHLPLMSTRPSLSGRVGVNRFQTAPSIWCGMFPRRVLASLRDRHLGPPMMGSGGCGGPIYRDVLAVRLTAGIRTRNGLALSIVPAGTSLHRSAEFVFSPVVFLLCTTRCELHECIDGTGALVCSVALSGQAPKPHSCAPQARGLTANAPTEQSSVLPAMRTTIGHSRSCGRSFFPGPAKLGAIHPYAMHDDCQSSRHGDDRALHATMPGNLHAPGLEPRPLAAVGHQDQRRLEQHLAHQGISAFRDAPHPVDLARLLPAWRQAKGGTDRLRTGEAGGHIDRGAKGQRDYWSDARCRH